MANSTARRFSTGNAPGYPRQTGQTCVFGAAPKVVEQPQKIFVAVERCACTSRPMTASHDMRGLCVIAVAGRFRAFRPYTIGGFRVMSRAVLFRIYVLAAIVLAVSAVVWTFSVASWTTLGALLFYAALVAVAVWVRVDDASPGFEAAVVFAAILLLHDPAVALISVFVGTAVLRIADDARRRTFRLDSLYDAAQLALSYYIVALLYASAVA